MTLFAEILHGCGLSHREAADYLKASAGSIASYASGRRVPPNGMLSELHELAARQEAAAEKALQIWEEAGEPDEIEIGIASDDHEAQSLGWPCRGAHAAVIRRLWEMLPPFTEFIVVPRGATLSSAAAADEHDRSK